MIGALGELSPPYMLWLFLNMRFKVASEWYTSPDGLHVDHSAQGFLTFKVGKTQFKGLCLLPLSRALGQLSKYEIKKGGSFHFEAVP